MTSISRLRRDLGLKAALAVVLVCLCAAGGCAKPQPLKLHYLNGFVPGSRAIFNAAGIAIPPPTGPLAADEHSVGAVYTADGYLQRELIVSNPGVTIQKALVTSLADAGLKPFEIPSNPRPQDLPTGLDLLLESELEQIQVMKRFGPQKTVHGQFFTMTSRVKIKFTLLNRDGETLYQEEMLGMEEEPPAPVAKEIFLPLETDPAESLSVALSRAVGGLLAQPNFRAPLPLRVRAFPTPTQGLPTPTAASTPIRHRRAPVAVEPEPAEPEPVEPQPEEEQDEQ